MILHQCNINGPLFFHRSSIFPWRISKHNPNQKELAEHLWSFVGCKVWCQGVFQETDPHLWHAQDFLKALSLQWVWIQLFAILYFGLDGSNVRLLLELGMWTSRGLSSTPVFTQPMMQEGCSHLRNCECSSWKVSQNLALTNSMLKHVLNLKCVLKLAKPASSTEKIFLCVGSLIC